jgi:citrate synthase
VPVAERSEKASLGIIGAVAPRSIRSISANPAQAAVINPPLATKPAEMPASNNRPIAPQRCRRAADGFGHRIFRHGDPRTAAIGEALKGFGPDAGRLAFAAKLERRVGAVFRRLKPGRPALQQNIEINAALLLDAASFARDAFTPVFAIGRCPGWIAHALQQRAERRLVRPSARYIGPKPAAG